MRIKYLLLTVLLVALPLAGQAQDSASTGEFRIDSDNSWLHVLAYPDGPLKRFGHSHVISHPGIAGTVDVATNPLESEIKLEFNVADFAVDDPATRTMEGEEFSAEVPQKDIDGTKANMLGEKLLNGVQFPTIRVESRAINGTMPNVNIVASVFVTGSEQTVTFPASIEIKGDTLTASGQLEITHGELGLEAFTAMGGALSVRDLLVLKYEITGTRVTENQD